MVRATLRNIGSGKTYVRPALVDSGADYSTFPLAWMDELGIDADKAIPDEIGGGLVQGTAMVSLVEIGVRVDRLPEFTAVVGFTDRMVQGYGVLGMSDFFSKFLVSFYPGLDFFDITC